MEAFALLAEFGLPSVFHPEDESIYQRLESRLRASGRRDGRAHAEARPDYVEAVSVGTLLRLAEHFGVHLHVPHVSSAMTVTLIDEAKARGVQVTAETCPHYLQFDASALARLGPYAKCNPPFKQREDIEALWDAVRDGTIDRWPLIIRPSPSPKKMRPRMISALGPPGFPGVETLALRHWGRARSSPELAAPERLAVRAAGARLRTLAEPRFHSAGSERRTDVLVTTPISSASSTIAPCTTRFQTRR